MEVTHSASAPPTPIQRVDSSKPYYPTCPSIYAAGLALFLLGVGGLIATACCFHRLPTANARVSCIAGSLLIIGVGGVPVVCWTRGRCKTRLPNHLTMGVGEIGRSYFGQNNSSPLTIHLTNVDNDAATLGYSGTVQNLVVDRSNQIAVADAKKLLEALQRALPTSQINVTGGKPIRAFVWAAYELHMCCDDPNCGTNTPTDIALYSDDSIVLADLKDGLAPQKVPTHLRLYKIAPDLPSISIRQHYIRDWAALCKRA